MRKYAFALIVVILVFALAETALRLAKVDVHAESWARLPIFEEDPILYWKLKANLRGAPYQDGLLDTNSLGLRDVEMGRRKPEGEIRIACLGDSSTFGFTVKQVEHTYPKVLEAKLNEQNKNHRFRTLNAGVPGYWAYQGLRFLQDKLLALSPDAITVYFGNNDCLISQGQCDDQIRWLDRFRRGLFKSSLYLFTRRKILKYRKQPLDHTEHNCSYSIAMERIIQTCQAHRVRVILITVPVALNFPMDEINAPDMASQEAMDAAFKLQEQMNKGESKDLISQAKGLVQQYPDFYLSHNLLARILESHGSIEDAADEYQKAIDLLKCGYFRAHSGHRKVCLEIASQYGIEIMDAYDLLKKDQGRFVVDWHVHFNDWIHPNQYGHRKIGENLAKLISSSPVE